MPKQLPVVQPPRFLSAVASSMKEDEAQDSEDEKRYNADGPFFGIKGDPGPPPARKSAKVIDESPTAESKKVTTEAQKKKQPKKGKKKRLGKDGTEDDVAREAASALEVLSKLNWKRPTARISYA